MRHSITAAATTTTTTAAAATRSVSNKVQLAFVFTPKQRSAQPLAFKGTHRAVRDIRCARSVCDDGDCGEGGVRVHGAIDTDSLGSWTDLQVVSDDKKISALCAAISAPAATATAAGSSAVPAPATAAPVSAADSLFAFVDVNLCGPGAVVKPGMCLFYCVVLRWALHTCDSSCSCGDGCLSTYRYSWAHILRGQHGWILHSGPRRRRMPVCELPRYGTHALTHTHTP
jgi:hypothetical protein